MLVLVSVMVVVMLCWISQCGLDYGTLQNWFNIYLVCRHLIGFFLFLSLTIYTAMKIPNVVDLPRLQNFSDVLRNADFQRLQTEITTCLPSFPHMPDMDLLTTLSNWHIMELLSNCIPERLSHTNHTDICVLVLFTLCSLPFSTLWFTLFVLLSAFWVWYSSKSNLSSHNPQIINCIMFKTRCTGLVVCFWINWTFLNSFKAYFRCISIVSYVLLEVMSLIKRSITLSNIKHYVNLRCWLRKFIVWHYLLDLNLMYQFTSSRHPLISLIQIPISQSFAA